VVHNEYTKNEKQAKKKAGIRVDNGVAILLEKSQLHNNHKKFDDRKELLY
jgi:hypothetical protein